MESINLSKLVLSHHFFELLEEENIHFDAIYTDNPTLQGQDNVNIITTDLTSFFSSLTKTNHILLILDKLGINDIINYIQDFSSLCILSANSLSASFSKKIHPEINHIPNLHNKITIAFPWDLENFLKALKSDKTTFIPLSNQEISENIYAAGVDAEEDELQFVDKSLIEKKNILSLLSPEKSDLCLIGMGNHFEELVKLSQLLAVNESRIALHIINQWDLLFSEEGKELFKDTKKLGIIIDHLSDTNLENQLKTLGKPIELITPHYDKITSIFPEYQFEQSDFNAIALYERVLELL